MSIRFRGVQSGMQFIAKFGCKIIVVVFCCQFNVLQAQRYAHALTKSVFIMDYFVFQLAHLTSDRGKTGRM